MNEHDRLSDAVVTYRLNFSKSDPWTMLNRVVGILGEVEVYTYTYSYPEIDEGSAMSEAAKHLPYQYTDVEEKRLSSCRPDQHGQVWELCPHCGFDAPKFRNTESFWAHTKPNGFLCPGLKRESAERNKAWRCSSGFSCTQHEYVVGKTISNVPGQCWCRERPEN